MLYNFSIYSDKLTFNEKGNTSSDHNPSPNGDRLEEFYCSRENMAFFFFTLNGVIFLDT